MAVCVTGASSAFATPDPHPNALWHVIHDLCVPDRRLLGLPLPCSRVDLAAGYAVVPDPGGAYQVLLAPTRRVTGIEDPFLLGASAPNYWQDAWRSRDLLARRVGAALPREAVAMAVNAAPGRSQEQLHIHVSCIRPDVADLLRTSALSSSEQGSSLLIDGHAWRLWSVAGTDLGETNPFKLYAGSQGEGDLSQVTLVVAAVRFSDGGAGFAVLARTADRSMGYQGHGEALLDETCRPWRGPPPPQQ